MRLREDISKLEKTGKHFMIGLILSLSFALMAFNWTVMKDERTVYSPEEVYIIDKDVEIIRTDHPPKEKPPVFEETVVIDPIIDPVPIADPVEKKPLIEKKELIVPTKAKVIRKVAVPEPPKIIVGIDDKNDTDGEILNFAQEMPHFYSADCEGLMNNEEKYKCAEKAMLEYCYQTLRYPSRARELGKEGLVVVSFVVNEEGKLANPEIIRPLGGGCSEEVLRIVNAMPDWIPGKQSGRKVKVRFTLPVRFALQ